ncbi:MAG TPA: hypothetical protein VF032_01450 [Thermoleophilaceae bacterium]
MGAVLVAALAAAGCGSAGSTNLPRPAEQHALRAYLRAIEPLRLHVNKLLGGTDPILRGYHEHRLTAAGAQHALRHLERRFVSYVNAVDAVRGVPPDLWGAQNAYARTYALEDRYLQALIAALPGRRWDRLPRSEPEQRRTIVAWRAALALEAARVQVPLPQDIEIAGNGEITPSPEGTT